ncbi:MAG: Taurine transport system permease protein TauC, partial [uncultured Thiotrichaceae bacterium]
MMVLAIYTAIFIVSFFVVRFIIKGIRGVRKDYTSLKTVTFGDESAVKPDRWASILSVLTIFLLWGAFTGSKWVPVHAPGPFVGDTSFTYTAENKEGAKDDATVYVRVSKVDVEVEDITAEPGDGFAKDDVAMIGAWRSKLILTDKNDEVTRKEGSQIVAINGQAIAPGGSVQVNDGRVALTAKGSINFTPDKGMQMEPIWLPSPEAVVSRVGDITKNGYQNFTLMEHLFWSIYRVILGFVLGALVGIPLGYAMGL